jgi:hypothetical protein
MAPGAAMGAMGAAAAAAIQISPFEAAILSLNSNPYFIGMMMLMLNLGGRFIAMEMTKSQEQFFQNPWVRRLLIFTVLFVGTRNVVVAFWMSILIILLIGYLFNENSSLCLFSFGEPGSSCATSSIQNPGVPVPPIQLPGIPGAQNVVGLTPEETEIFRRLNDKVARVQSTLPPEQAKPQDKKLSDIYWENMAVMKQADGFFGNPRF